MPVHVARQPICNRKEEVIAYELLYRHRLEDNHSLFTNGDQATANVLLTSFLNIGIDRLSEGKSLFINFTENLLLKEVPLLLPKEEVVIEILEDTKATQDIIDVCQNLKKKGYKIALDDFFLTKYNQEFIQFADIIKVDFLHSTPRERAQLKKSLPFPHIYWLAEKIETRAQFEEAKKAGFHFFQGFFFSKPILLTGNSIPTFSTNYFAILNELDLPVPNIKKISSLIEKDLSLSYQLLKLLNKPSFLKRKTINTIPQAIRLMGLTELKKMAGSY
ncbi:MAG TPA: HDOD domain-containing protein [Chondromyces sp.]|nr:HDOD domain-containing protein [Chondromyces sp.]